MAGTQEFTTRPELAGTFGMVASTHWLASAAGMAVLEAGGNAFDAAVATGLVLQVVEPHLNGPGGEVPIIGYSASGGGEFVINGQGTAPAAATVEAFSDLGISDLVPGNGLLPAMVPGAFGAWMLLLQRYGTLRLRDVMSYAIGYAGDGYPMLPGASAAIEAMSETFTIHWPTSAEVYLADGTPAAGDKFANKTLADTYARVLAEAEAASTDRDAQIEAARLAWYEGFVAAAIDDFAASAQIMDVTGRKNPCLLRGADLAGWRASVEEPVRLRLPRADGVQDRSVGARAGLPPATRAARRLRPGRHEAGQCRIDPHRDRGRQAGVRRSRGLVRRSQAHRRADRGPAVGRLHGRAPAARHRPGVSRAGAGIARRQAASPARVRHRRRFGCSARQRDRRADARRHRAGRRDPGRRRARAGGHLSPGHRRPVRQPDLRHAERRLAAEFAGRARPRLLPGHQGPDVRAHARIRQHPGPRPAAADHAVAEPGAAGRRAVYGIRDARR